MVELLEKLICIILSLGILANAIIVRRMVGSWIFPAVIFSLFWFLFTIVPLVLLFTVPIHPAGMLFIFLCTVVFSLSGMQRGWQDAFRFSQKIKVPQREWLQSAWVSRAFWGGLVAAVLCLIGNSARQGFSLSTLLQNLQQSAADYAVRRYMQDIEVSAYQQISTVLAYLVAALGGLLISQRNSVTKTFVVAASALLPAIFVMLTQSAKGMLLLCISVFYAGVVIVRLQDGRSDLMDRRSLRYALVSVAILAPIVTLSFLARASGLTPSQATDFLIASWASYTSGHLYAFSDWFSFTIGGPSIQPYINYDLTGGFYTFMSLFRAMGDDRVIPLGTYAEYYDWYPYLRTNIYTFYRGIIIDYGILGSIIFIFFVGLIIHRLFRLFLMQARPTYSAAVFVLFVSFTAQSFGASVLMWNSLPVSCVLLGIILHLARVASMPTRAISTDRVFGSEV